MPLGSQCLRFIYRHFDIAIVIRARWQCHNSIWRDIYAAADERFTSPFIIIYGHLVSEPCLFSADAAGPPRLLLALPTTRYLQKSTFKNEDFMPLIWRY